MCGTISAASCSGPDGRRGASPVSSRTASSHSRSAPDRTGAARCARARATRRSRCSRAAARSAASRASASISRQHVGFERALIERDLADARHRRHDLRLDVDHADRADDAARRGVEWRSAISRQASAVCAAARNASRRIGIGVDPECAAWPMKRSMCRSTPKVPSTTPVGLLQRLEHRPLLDVQLEIGARRRSSSARGARRASGRASTPFSAQRVDEPRPLPVGQPADARRPSRLPLAADEPSRLRPNRAPSSSAQSTSFERHRRRASARSMRSASSPAITPSAAVEPAAVRHRVEMAADDDRLAPTRRAASPSCCRPHRCRPCSPSSRDPAVEPRARVAPHRPPGEALRAVGRRGERGELAQVGDDGIGAHDPGTLRLRSRSSSRGRP